MSKSNWLSSHSWMLALVVPLVIPDGVFAQAPEDDEGMVRVRALSAVTPLASVLSRYLPRKTLECQVT